MRDLAGICITPSSAKVLLLLPRGLTKPVSAPKRFETIRHESAQIGERGTPYIDGADGEDQQISICVPEDHVCFVFVGLVWSQRHQERY